MTPIYTKANISSCIAENESHGFFDTFERGIFAVMLN